MSEIKLLPCPFCGGEAEIDNSVANAVSVECTMCHASSPIFLRTGDREQKAIEAWNTRKPMERIKERIDEKMESVDYWAKPFDKYEYYDNGFWEGMNEVATIVKEEGGIK